MKQDPEALFLTSVTKMEVLHTLADESMRVSRHRDTPRAEILDKDNTVLLTPYQIKNPQLSPYFANRPFNNPIAPPLYPPPKMAQ